MLEVVKPTPLRDSRDLRTETHQQLQHRPVPLVRRHHEDAFCPRGHLVARKLGTICEEAFDFFQISLMQSLIEPNVQLVLPIIDFPRFNQLPSQLWTSEGTLEKQCDLIVTSILGHSQKRVPKRIRLVARVEGPLGNQRTNQGKMSVSHRKV